MTLHPDVEINVTTGNCTPEFWDYIDLPPGHLAVRMALLKWDGAAAQVCQMFSEWSFSPSWWPRAAWLDVETEACGDGHYNLMAEGCAWVDGAWRCSISFSGWLWADVNDNPSVPLN